MSEYYDRVARAAQTVLAQAKIQPRVGLVLGSGWGAQLENITDEVRVSYRDVPGMMSSTVPGHAGEWVLCRIGGTPVAVMSGRLHYYEGYDLKDVTFPTRMMKLMGVETLILTNAAGAVNTAYAPSDLMILSDHINLTGANPLFGPNEDEFGPRFPDMSRIYDPELIEGALSAAASCGVRAHKGVYCWMTGPSFETPAEIRMIRALGGDAVGMSTVPEAICAAHMGMKVMGISCLTNMAAGVLDQPLTHEEVLETSRRAFPGIQAFLMKLIGEM